MSFFDIVLDFILMDAFEDLENPPSSVLAVLRNRWLSDSFKETVCGRPPLPGTHTCDPMCVARTPRPSIPGVGPRGWIPTHHGAVTPTHLGQAAGRWAPQRLPCRTFQGSPPLLSSHSCRGAGCVFSSCLIVSFGQFHSFLAAISSIPFECIQSS